MLRDLVKLADHLDRKGLSKEANFLDSIIKKSSEDLSEYFDGNKVIDERGDTMFDLPEPRPTKGAKGNLDEVVDMIRGLDEDLKEELLRMIGTGGPLSMGSSQ